MNIKLPITIICLLLISAAALAQNESKKMAPRCHITVHHLRKSGETSERTFDLALKSKAACEKAAKIHKTNFSPAAIAKVEVSTKWDGK